MTQALSAEEKARLKRQWTDLAIRQALDSQWAEAAATNRNILNLFPNEPDAYNRLGKACSELGQYEEARQAYSQTLKYSPNNTIAKKQLDRLSQLQEVAAPAPSNSQSIDPRLLNVEPGKTGVTELLNLAPASVLATVSVGDKVFPHVSGHTLFIRNGASEDIGQVEPKLANRLISFIEGGNRYAAGVLAIEPGLVRIIMREEYQHPSMFGKVSFTSQGGGDTIRAYIKDSMLRYDRDEDEEMLNDDEYYDGTDETEELAEVDFEASSDIEE